MKPFTYNIYQAGVGFFGQVPEFIPELSSETLTAAGYELSDELIGNESDKYQVQVYRNIQGEFQFLVDVGNNYTGHSNIVVCTTFGDYLAFVKEYLPLFVQMAKTAHFSDIAAGYLGGEL